MLKKSENHENLTQVELFFDKELSDITFEVEALDEWKGIAAELGMEKQMALTKGKESPVPFPWMNNPMQRVYSTMCPTIVDYKEYNKTPIPLEVMKQIAFCIREKHFNAIEIWYDDKSIDPLVVGVIARFYGYKKEAGSTDSVRVEFNTKEECEAVVGKGNSYRTDVNNYLVARWGDVRRSFDELKKMAVERFIEKHSSKMRSEIETLTSKLKVIKENAQLYFMGEMSESEATTTSKW